MRIRSSVPRRCPGGLGTVGLSESGVDNLVEGGTQCSMTRGRRVRSSSGRRPHGRRRSQRSQSGVRGLRPPVQGPEELVDPTWGSRRHGGAGGRLVSGLAGVMACAGAGRTARSAARTIATAITQTAVPHGLVGDAGDLSGGRHGGHYTGLAGPSGKHGHFTGSLYSRQDIVSDKNTSNGVTPSRDDRLPLRIVLPPS